MPSLSVFQLLPPHIVQAIVSHVEGCNRLSFNNPFDDPKERLELPTPLLWVCHNFRDVVYAHYSKHCKILIKCAQNEVETGWPGWPSHFQAHVHPSYRLVKKLTIATDMQSIFSDSALDMLSRTPFGGCSFPRAYSLVCNISWPPRNPSLQEQEAVDVVCPRNAEVNVCAFVQRVKQMVRLSNDITVDLPNVPANLHSSFQNLLGSFVAQFYQSASRVKHFYGGHTIPMLQHSGSIDSLVYFTYESRNETADTSVLLMQLVQRNASTLQYLDLDLKKAVDMTGLIRDAGDNYTKYPCLVTLKLEVGEYWNDSLPRVASDVVLFPNLRHLSILEDYPFSDDILFRGNSSSLKHLRIMPKRNLSEILGEYRVFTPTSHPKLQYVRVEELLGAIQDEFESFEDYIQFVLGMTPSAAVWDIANVKAKVDVRFALGLLWTHASIQILSLPDTRLYLWDAVSLIKLLPLLTDLHCRSTYASNLTDEFNADFPDDFPDDFTGDFTDDLNDDYASFKAATQMCSLSNLKIEQFRCWHFEDEDYGLLENTMSCVLTVAAICPNFDFVV
ncbi:hypothetical protein GGI19_005528, partial [Coemansia pectinata]